MKEITLDEYFDFDRPTGYTPPSHLTTEDEIRSICKQNKIVVAGIVKFEVYRVTGKKIRNKKTFEMLNGYNQ